MIKQNQNSIYTQGWGPIEITDLVANNTN